MIKFFLYLAGAILAFLFFQNQANAITFNDIKYYWNFDTAETFNTYYSRYYDEIASTTRADEINESFNYLYQSSDNPFDDDGNSVGYHGNGGTIDENYLGVYDSVDNPDTKEDWIDNGEEFSISVWFKATSTPSDLMYTLFSLDAISPSVLQGVNSQLDLRSTGMIQYAYYSDQNNWVRFQSDDNWSVFDSSWHNLIIQGTQGSATDMEMYIDGVEISASWDNTGNLGDFDNETGLRGYIGGRYGGDYTFGGLLDEFVLYDRKLTSSEITNIQTNSIGNIIDNPFTGIYSIFQSSDIDYQDNGLAVYGSNCYFDQTCTIKLYYNTEVYDGFWAGIEYANDGLGDGIIASSTLSNENQYVELEVYQLSSEATSTVIYYDLYIDGVVFGSSPYCATSGDDRFNNPDYCLQKLEDIPVKYIDSSYLLEDNISSMFATTTDACVGITAPSGTFDNLRYGIECGFRKLIYWGVYPDADSFLLIDEKKDLLLQNFPFSIYSQTKSIFDYVKDNVSSGISEYIGLDNNLMPTNSTGTILFSDDMLDEYSWYQTFYNYIGYFLYGITVFYILFNILHRKD